MINIKKIIYTRNASIYGTTSNTGKTSVPSITGSTVNAGISGIAVNLQVNYSSLTYADAI